MALSRVPGGISEGRSTLGPGSPPENKGDKSPALGRDKDTVYYCFSLHEYVINMSLYIFMYGMIDLYI